MKNCKMLGLLPIKGNEAIRRVYDAEALAPTIVTTSGGNHEPKIAETVCLNPKVNGKQPSLSDRVYAGNGISTAITTTPFFMGSIEEKEMKRLRIRKLTEGECMRFMGFERKDTEACRKAGLSRANIYHSAGDSIITTVLVGIFGELLGLDYEKAIGDYCDKLHGEVYGN